MTRDDILKQAAVQVMDFRGLKEFMQNDDIENMPDVVLQRCVCTHMLYRIKKLLGIGDDHSRTETAGETRAGQQP